MVNSFTYVCVSDLPLWFIHACRCLSIWEHTCAFMWYQFLWVRSVHEGVSFGILRYWLVIHLLYYVMKVKHFIYWCVLPYGSFLILVFHFKSTHPLGVKMFFQRLVTLTRNSEGLKFLGHKIVKSYRNWVSAESVCSQQFQYKKFDFRAPWGQTSVGLIMSSDSIYFTASGWLFGSVLKLWHAPTGTGQGIQRFSYQIKHT